MKRTMTAAVLALAAASLFAQPGHAAETKKHEKTAPKAAASTSTDPNATKVVAVVNGETITRADLDRMWFKMAPPLRQNYEKAGGKGAFLDNYIRKRLVVQKAMREGVDKRPEVQADIQLAKESAIFDRYVRDVVASSIISDSDMVDYYNKHKSEFTQPEEVKVRHIIVIPGGKQAKTKEEAQQIVEKIARDLNDAIKDVKDPVAASELLKTKFSEAAQKHSDDGTAKDGGSLPWTGRGAFDPAFEQAAFALKAGSMSPVIESSFGFHLIYVEGKRGGTLQGFDEAKAQIREDLLAEKQAAVMGAVARLTNDLRLAGKVRVNKENID